MRTGMRVKLMGALCAGLLLSGMVFAPESPVAEAARRNDIEAVRALIKQGVDVKVAQGDGMTALHWAAEHGNVEMTRLLLKAGASVKAGTRIGNYTPVHIASQAGSAPVLKLLIDAGGDVNGVTSNSGVTPLHLAASAGDPRAIALLLDRGANANARDPEFGQTPLMFAADAGNAAAIKVLVQKGADPNIATRTLVFREAQALDQAANRKRTEILTGGRAADSARLRAAAGPRLAADGRPEARGVGATRGPEFTPAQIQAAIEASREVYAGQVKVDERAAPVREQRDPNADPDDPPPDPGLIGAMGGLTALHHAAREGHADAVKALLDGGAKINTVSGADKTSPLLMATVNGQFDAAMVLIDHGADPNLASEPGTTPLYAVLERRWANRTRFPQPSTVDHQKTDYLDVMKALLVAGANPDARLTKHLYYMTYTGCGNANCGLETVQGATPFWRAAYATDVAAMQLLYSFGANPNTPTLRAAGGNRGGGGGGRRGGGGGRGGAGGGPDAAPGQQAAGQQAAAGQAAGGQQAAVGQQAGVQGQAGAPARAAANPGTQRGGGAGNDDAGQRGSGAPGEGGRGGGAPQPDPSGLPPAQPGGPAVFPLHAAAGVGYGEGFAGNSHRHAPDGWLPSVKFLIEVVGVDVNQRDENGYTALHHAAARGDNELIMYLVSKGADVTVVSRRGQTTADMANGPVSRITPYPETVKLLESLGSKNNHRCASC